MAVLFLLILIHSVLCDNMHWVDYSGRIEYHWESLSKPPETPYIEYIGNFQFLFNLGTDVGVYCQGKKASVIRKDLRTGDCWILGEHELAHVVSSKDSAVDGHGLTISYRSTFKCPLSSGFTKTVFILICALKEDAFRLLGSPEGCEIIIEKSDPLACGTHYVSSH